MAKFLKTHENEKCSPETEYSPAHLQKSFCNKFASEFTNLHYFCRWTRKWTLKCSAKWLQLCSSWLLTLTCPCVQSHIFGMYLWNAFLWPNEAIFGQDFSFWALFTTYSVSRHQIMQRSRKLFFSRNFASSAQLPNLALRFLGRQERSGAEN